MTTFSIAALAAITLSAAARPLERDMVSSDAKWLVHLDLENLRQTRVGQFLTKDVAGQKLIEAKALLSIRLDFNLDQIQSLTAYGIDYKSNDGGTGVLLLQADRKGRDELKRFAKEQASQTNQLAIKRLDHDHLEIYQVQDELFVAFAGRDCVLASKSRAALNAADEVLRGKAPSLKGTPVFSDYPEIPNTFFFLGIAEGFNEHAAIPPQAKVFQMADGARLALGESSAKLFLNVALRAKTGDVSRQMHQVLQGLLALITLSQGNNPDLQQLARSTKVEATEKMVSVNLEFPVNQAIEKIDEHIDGHPDNDRKPKNKSGSSDQKDKDGKREP